VSPDQAVLITGADSENCSYQLLDEIGRGATGAVWRARKTTSGAMVAVKVLRADGMSDPKTVARFLQERAILRALRHSNIVRVRDLVRTTDGSLALVMDLVDGGSLREHLAEVGVLAPAVAAAMLAQVADALAAAHALGVVHRDLKPDNVLIDHRRWSSTAGPSTANPAPAGAGAVLLTDFGIARVLDQPTLTTPGALLGTPNYLAPEVIRGGAVGPAVDVYAMGIMLYELVVGRSPYAGGPQTAVLLRHLNGTPRRVSGIPEAIWSLVTACVDKEPARRPTAAALADALREAAGAADGVPPARPLPAGAEPFATHVLVDGRVPAPRPAPAEDIRVPPAAPDVAPRPARRTRAVTVVLLVTAVVVAAVLVIAHGRPWIGAGPDGPARAAAPRRARSGGVAVQAPPPGPGASRLVPSGGGDVDPSFGLRASLRAKLPADPAYGPPHCTDTYAWDVGHPAIGRPCYALGPHVRVWGGMEALPGVRVDVRLTLHNADTDAPVGSGQTCRGVEVTEWNREYGCGPFDLSPPHGHRYLVVETWTYSDGEFLPDGSVNGEPFDW
jgi:serine/threonine-protein kinase